MPAPSSRSTVNAHALTRVGSTVGKYRIARLLGIGGMAAVYAATHRNGNRVALKFLLEGLAEDSTVLKLFAREAYLANRIDHPGAVPVLDDDVDERGCPFLVMPLLEGETLRARWERAGKRLPVAEVALLMSEVLDVLASAHAQGVVHRDIKPDNIFVTADGHARVLDFGIARRVDPDGFVTLTGPLLGTPAFMAPEQALGDREAVGPCTDIWAVGATMFALLSGELVHAADNLGAQLVAIATRPARSLAEVAPAVPEVIVRCIDKALSLDRAERWPSAEAMRDALMAALEQAAGEPVPSLAASVRAKLVAELATDLGETRVTKQAAIRRLAPKVDSGIEIRATPLFRAFRLVPAIAHRILAKHGLGRFSQMGRFIPDARAWWPREAFVAALREIGEAVGPAKMVEIGQLKAKLHCAPPRLAADGSAPAFPLDIRSALKMVDVAYHLDIRVHGKLAFDVATGQMLEGVGNLRYGGEIAPNCIAIECSTPYPCEIDLGVGMAMCRRFEPLAIVEHAPGGCRKDGAEQCVYHVTW
ncbi:serine/threonine protein kinase [Pendulispora brunnea]|uniref:Serine/threonine protein kinase n=1 Tax=Pendulispora brunnea TaxID=2905690 RepID=A0ABZ2K8X7_9BACT